MDLIDAQMELSAAGREDLAIFVYSEFSRLQKTGRDAAKELTRLADELKQSSTVCGEWDGSEAQAKDEYDTLMALAARLTPNVLAQGRGDSKRSLLAERPTGAAG